MKVSWKLFFVLMLAVVFSIGAFASDLDMDRSETLVVSGAMWGPPSNWNPLNANPAAGTGGLVYETMFRYNPLENEYVPNLAESGEWTSDDVYTLKLREGLTWTDGEALTAEDVAFTYEIARDNELTYTPIWDWLGSVEVIDDYTVQFNFDEPRFAEWDGELYNRYIIPEHIWSEVPSDELMTKANANGVGSGPYMYDSVSQQRMVWVRNDDWWGNDVFGTPKPKYIVDLVNMSNNVTLGMLMKGEIDLSNNFLPGVERLKETFDLETWYEEEPYMLSWNTAKVYMNTKVKPMDDPAFRRALAFAINQDTIVERVYGGLVEPANPTGLFGEGWLEYLDEDVVAEYGFNFDPTTAEAMLDEAGYVDADGDGWRDMPNGDPIELEIIVPSGWTDWMEAIRVVSNDAQAIGVNIEVAFPDASVYDERRMNGTFELLINNYQSTLSSNPFDYWNGVANSNIYGDQITAGNYGAYENQELFDMIAEFNMTFDEDRQHELASEIQKILLVDMPAIPLWHNGLWAQQTELNWTNWPSEDDPYGIPVSWGDSYQLGMIDVLINLEPVN
ncbi:MAG: ABC transporter substrate-binding protein [Halanaerobiaceae bacterium]